MSTCKKVFICIYMYDTIFCMSSTVTMCIVWWYLIFGLVVSGKGVLSSCPGYFGMLVSCSRSIIVLYVLILVTGSVKGNFVLGVSTCLILLFGCLLIY